LQIRDFLSAEFWRAASDEAGSPTDML
jgi:hypothetical protein